MDFNSLFTQVLSNGDSAGSFLADATMTCPYPEIPGALESIDQYLLDKGVEYDKALAVQCNNSVLGALLLILLLQKKATFILLPPSGNGKTDFSFQPIPRFYRRCITVKAMNKEDRALGFRVPERFLRVEQYSGASQKDFMSKSLGAAANLLFRTSGSMGNTKIIVHSHQKAHANANNCRRRYQFTAEDRVFLPVPIFHSYGFGTGFLPAVSAGSSLFLQQNSNILNYLDCERTFHPTMAVVTPTLCEMVLHGKKTPTNYKAVITSGQRMKNDVFHAFDDLCGNSLVNQYGSTEMGAVASCNPRDPAEMRCATIGHPMEGVQLRVEAADYQKDELFCRHPCGFSGYMDEEGNWTSQAREWHPTGDLAKIRDDGFIEIRGRADHCVNRRGRLVLLADIEKTMESLDFLSHVSVVAAQSEDIQGQRLVACCILQKECLLTELQIRSAAVQKLPKHAVPDEVLIIPALPVLPGGKVDQQTLRTWAEEKISAGKRENGKLS